MRVRIHPAAADDAIITVPSAKSLAHRALIAAALAEGRSILHDLDLNEDLSATIDCLRKTGSSFSRQGSDLIVDGKGITYDGSLLDVKESASTLRFLLPLLVNTGRLCRFRTAKRLLYRPLGIYEEIIRKNGGSFLIEDDLLEVKGRFPAAEYRIRGDISSQFISGLLFLLPLLTEDSAIEVLPPFESSSYVALTVDILNKAGIRIDKEGLIYKIAGNQRYLPFDYRIEADHSSAAFFIIEALINGRRTRISRLHSRSLQPDSRLIAIVSSAGARIIEDEDGIVISGQIDKGMKIDLSDCPDLGPILFVLAASCPEPFTFTNTARLRYKESDRIAAMEEELLKTGIAFHSEENSVRITGNRTFKGGVTFNSHHDHRVAMALSILSAAAQEPCIIENAEAVTKSFPSFFEELGRLANVEYL